MNGAALQRSDALRARSQAFMDRVGRTYERAADRLQLISPAYVATSGGKDSLVALHIAASLQPGIAALWVDDELEWQETPAAVQDQASHVGSPLYSKRGTTTHNQWFTPWTDEPFWREPLDTCSSIRERSPQWAARNGFTGVILGTRGSESSGRRVHANVHGDAYERNRAMQWVFQPIIDWSVEDVWAYIAMNDLPYHPTYDLMSAAGIPREGSHGGHQRIGPLTNSPRWILQAVDPTLPSRLEARYGRHW